MKSIRLGNFQDYKDTLGQLIPWAFALDHTHYARCLSVHLRDMGTLDETHPALYAEFCKGPFVGQKSKKAFSMLALDQMHEQLIATLKADGGIIGVTENANAMRRHLVAGPELSRIIEEFEMNSKAPDTKHHEQYLQFQRTFRQNVEDLVQAMEETGNQFLEDSGQLIQLDTSIVMSEEVSRSVMNAEAIGWDQYSTFVKERMEHRTTAWSATIPRNNLPLMSHKESSKSKSDVAVVKEERGKVLHILNAALSGRNIDESVFSHEISSTPPSLTRRGEMFHGTKADIVPCIEAGLPPSPQSWPPIDAIVMDGPAIIHMVRPGLSATIEEYITQRFQPYVVQHLDSVWRVDLVWDVYRPDSLKQGIRETRGHGVRRRVQGSTKVPSNWSGFLRVDGNKTDLFALIAQSVMSMPVPEGKEVISTSGATVVSQPPRVDGVASLDSTHEEADTRVFVHVADMLHRGHTSIMVRTTDSDVVIIAVSVVQHLRSLGLQELWVAYGTGASFRYIPAHNVARHLGDARSLGLLTFHSMTGCDTVSAFFGKGKKTAWEVWQQFPDVTWALQRLSGAPPTTPTIPDEVMATMEEFVARVYGIDAVGVDKARLEGFYHKGLDFDHLPPCSDALELHLLRATYQAGHVWGKSLFRSPDVPDPSQWGWRKEHGVWRPIWLRHDIISKALPQLSTCKCTKACRPPCKCCMAKVPCTPLCFCRGRCYGKPRYVE